MFNLVNDPLPGPTALDLLRAGSIMRPTQQHQYQGGATMKFRVALFFLLAVFGSVAIAQRQPQRQNKSAVSKSPSQTIRICQGIPIPDGYVIIAYMTSTACPHGA